MAKQGSTKMFADAAASAGTKQAATKSKIAKGGGRKVGGNAVRRPVKDKAATNAVADPEGRTTMQLSITYADKQYLQIYALMHDTSAASVVHELIASLREANGELLA